MPWFNPENRRKALISAMKAENHLETMKLHSHSQEISDVERKRFSGLAAEVNKLWDADMDEWLLDRVGKTTSQLEAEQISG